MWRPRLRWTDHGTGYWSAVGRTGTDWEIRDFGRAGPARFGITVANWDHPDWWTATLREAKALAAEIDARPPIPESEWIDERPVVMPDRGDEYETWDTRRRPPAGPCSCGSERLAEAVKPRRLSSEWWDDPAPYWRCPACGSYRGGIDR